MQEVKYCPNNQQMNIEFVDTIISRFVAFRPSEMHYKQLSNWQPLSEELVSRRVLFDN